MTPVFIIISALILLSSIQSIHTNANRETRKGIHFGKGLRMDPEFDKLHIFTTIPDVSFTECVKQCKRRYVCGFVHFRIRSNMCYILRTQDPYVQVVEAVFVELPGFVLGVKSEWPESEITDVSTELAEPEPPCGPRFHITNTRQTGNLDNTKGMVMYTCDISQDIDLYVCERWNNVSEFIRLGIDTVDAIVGCKKSYRDECSKHSGHTACYIMFWESQNGAIPLDGGRRRLNKILSVDNGAPQGDWHPRQYCPDGTFAVAYTVEICRHRQMPLFYDDTAMNSIVLHCASIKDSVTPTFSDVTSGRQVWGDTFFSYECPSDDGEMHVLTSFQMKVESYQGSDDDTGVNNVLFKCRDFNGTLPETSVTTEDQGMWGTYGQWSESCPPKSAICGLETRVEAYQGHFRDDLALTDMRAVCCRI